MKLILKELREKLNYFKLRGDTPNIRKFSRYVMAMITYLRQCIICPLIPITTVAIDVSDFEQRSDLSEVFMKSIKSMGIDEWLNDIGSLKSSRIESVCNTVNKHKNERVIIFSCFRTVLDILELYLPKDRAIMTISGSDKINARTATIENFRADDDGILLLTYDIGSNGLNLQCGSTVLLVDFWWNAGITAQAVARILRRGQEADTVNIYYFTANSGMENALFKLQKSKLRIEQEIMNGPVTTKKTLIKTDEILKIIDTQDNITILDNIYIKK